MRMWLFTIIALTFVMTSAAQDSTPVVLNQPYGYQTTLDTQIGFLYPEDWYSRSFELGVGFVFVTANAERLARGSNGDDVYALRPGEYHIVVSMIPRANYLAMYGLDYQDDVDLETLNDLAAQRFDAEGRIESIEEQDIGIVFDEDDVLGLIDFGDVGFVTFSGSTTIAEGDIETLEDIILGMAATTVSGDDANEMVADATLNEPSDDLLDLFDTSTTELGEAYSYTIPELETTIKFGYPDEWANDILELEQGFDVMIASDSRWLDVETILQDGDDFFIDVAFLPQDVFLSRFRVETTDEFIEILRTESDMLNAQRPFELDILYVEDRPIIVMQSPENAGSNIIYEISDAGFITITGITGANAGRYELLATMVAIVESLTITD